MLLYAHQTSPLPFFLLKKVTCHCQVATRRLHEVMLLQLEFEDGGLPAYLQKKLIQYLLFYQRVQISDENSPIGIAGTAWHRHTACQKH